MLENQKVKDLEKSLIELGFVNEKGEITEEGKEALLRFVPIPEQLANGIEIEEDGNLKAYCLEHIVDEGARIDSFQLVIEIDDPKEEGAALFSKKENVVALRDYLNKFLEQYFD